MDPIDLLTTLPLFGGLSKERASDLAATSSFRRVERDQHIVKEGDVGYTMYVVVRGRVAVSRVNEQGERVLFHELGAGEFFGEMSLLAGMKRTADVIAVKPTQLLAIERDALLRCVAGSPEVAMRIITHLCWRIRQADTARISRQTVRQRLVGALLAIATVPDGAGPGSKALVASVSRTALAKRILARRETVSRELSILAKEGYLSLRNKRVLIPDPAKLQELAE